MKRVKIILLIVATITIISCENKDYDFAGTYDISYASDFINHNKLQQDTTKAQMLFLLLLSDTTQAKEMLPKTLIIKDSTLCVMYSDDTTLIRFKYNKVSDSVINFITETKDTFVFSHGKECSLEMNWLKLELNKK